MMRWMFAMPRSPMRTDPPEPSIVARMSESDMRVSRSRISPSGAHSRDPSAHAGYTLFSPPRLATLADAFHLGIDFCVFGIDRGVAGDFGAGVGHAIDSAAGPVGRSVR